MMDDFDDFIDEPEGTDDFYNKTWKVVKTVPNGFSVGALFNYRDIVYMKEMIPCLEGTVFVNTKTGKERVLRNKEYNAKKIVQLARSELADTNYEHFLYGLDYTRESVELLVRRINKSNAVLDPVIKNARFFEAIRMYFGEDVCQ
jgi:hypothetical protein